MRRRRLKCSSTSVLCLCISGVRTRCSFLFVFFIPFSYFSALCVRAFFSSFSFFFLFSVPVAPSSPAPGSPAPAVAVMAPALPPAQTRSESDAAFRSQMERAITRRAHQRQSWFSSLSAVLDERAADDVDAACVALFRVCSLTKKQLSQERSATHGRAAICFSSWLWSFLVLFFFLSFCFLTSSRPFALCICVVLCCVGAAFYSSRYVRVQQLQDAFGDGVSLSSPNREVLREGLLWRCKAPPTGSFSPDAGAPGADAFGGATNGSAGATTATVMGASSLRPFYFFLLTDLLVVASDGGGDPAAPYKWKHAFHLSMLRCEDLPPQDHAHPRKDNSGQQRCAAPRRAMGATAG